MPSRASVSGSNATVSWLPDSGQVTSSTFQILVGGTWTAYTPSLSESGFYSVTFPLPAAGTYQFCTVSNEASFSFLDGKPLVHWPGRHTVERGMRGEN